MEIRYSLNRCWSEHRWLIFVIVMAFLLRVWGINYGMPYTFVGHESELVSGPAKGLINRDLFPGIMRQGHLFFNILMVEYALVAPAKYLIDFVSGVRYDSLADFAEALKNSRGLFLFVARFNCVLFGTATVLLVFQIGRKLYNYTVGLTAATLIAFLNLHIIWSHYARIDIPAAFFLTLTMLIAARLYQNGKSKDYLLLGFLVGVSIAGRFPNFVYLAPLYLTTHFLNVISNRKITQKLFVNKYFIYGLLLIPIGFICAMPYSVIRLREFFNTILGEFGMGATQLAVYPRLYGFWETLCHYLASTRNTMRASYSLRYAFGEPYEIAIGISFLYLVFKRKAKDMLFLIPAALFCLYIISIGKPATRWFVPIIPFFALSIAIFLNDLAEKLNVAEHKKKYFIGLMVSIILSVSVYRVVIFDYISTQKDTRVNAKEWIDKNIPRDRTIGFFRLHMFNPPLIDYDYVRISVISRNTDNALQKDRARPISYYKDLGINYLVVSSFFTDTYTYPDFVEEYPETSRSYLNFFGTLEKDADLVYEIKPVSRFAPGPTIKLYSLKNYNNGHKKQGQTARTNHGKN